MYKAIYISLLLSFHTAEIHPRSINDYNLASLSPPYIVQQSSNSHTHMSPSIMSHVSLLSPDVVSISENIPALSPKVSPHLYISLPPLVSVSSSQLVLTSSLHTTTIMLSLVSDAGIKSTSHSFPNVSPLFQIHQHTFTISRHTCDE